MFSFLIKYPAVLPIFLTAGVVFSSGWYLGGVKNETACNARLGAIKDVGITEILKSVSDVNNVTKTVDTVHDSALDSVLAASGWLRPE